MLVRTSIIAFVQFVLRIARNNDTDKLVISFIKVYLRYIESLIHLMYLKTSPELNSCGVLTKQ